MKFYLKVFLKTGELVLEKIYTSKEQALAEFMPDIFDIFALYGSNWDELHFIAQKIDDDIAKI